MATPPQTSSGLLLCFRRIHVAVEKIAPWSILISAVGLCIAAAGLMLTYYQLEKERNLREAIMLSLAHERIEAAREHYKRSNRLARQDAGQIRVLELMVKLGIKLRDVDLSGVRLAGAKLAGIDLRGSDISCTTLSRADFSHADLSDTHIKVTQLRGTMLANADFSNSTLADSFFRKTDVSGADFNGANLNNVEFVKVDLSAARNLSKRQIDRACGKDVILPNNWKMKPCSKEQEEERRRERKNCVKYMQRGVNNK